MLAKSKASKTASANLRFEAKLWLAADSRSAAETAEGNPRNNMDAAEGEFGDISIYGQQSNVTARRLVFMNLASCRIDAESGKENTAPFRNVEYPDLCADYVLSNDSMSCNPSGAGASLSEARQHKRGWILRFS